MRKITGFSVKYPVTILMMILGIILLGYISYSKLGTDLFPNLNNPKLYIELKAGEKPPEEIEKQYTEQIEAQASRQEGVVSVSSSSKVGNCYIEVEYNWEQDMDAAFLDLQKATSSFAQNEEITSINISRFDPNAEPIMLIAMEHNSITDMNELRKTAENYVRNELIRIEGIADVHISGQEESEIIIRTNNYLLGAYGLTTDNIVSKIKSLNRNVSGGTISEGGLQYIVKGVKILNSLNDISNIIVGFKTSESDKNNTNKSQVPIYLQDIATVSLINKEPDNIVQFNHKRCLGLSVYKETKYNTVNAVETLNSTLKEIEKALPGYKFHIINNQGKFISDAIGEVKDSALTGIFLAMIVLFVFLRRINSTLIVSISIPISIIATFNLMYFNGLTLNIMTLGGLALGAGMLVDNAIVVMESIFRNLEKELSPKEAAIKGTAEVGGAITASTLTTIVVFLPIVYLHGASGELFKDQAWTVAFSLISSLFVAILVIPMLASRFLKKKTKSKENKAKGFEWYGDLLDKIIEKRVLILLSSLVIVVGSFLLIPLIGSEFMPKSESKKFSIEMTLPEGSQLTSTAKTLNSVESIIKDIVEDDLDFIYSHVGPSTITSNNKNSQEDINTANIVVRIKKESNISVNNLIAHLDKTLSSYTNIKFKFKKEESAMSAVLGSNEEPIVIETYGEDITSIKNINNEIINKIKDIDNLYEINSSFEKGSPEVDIKIDRLRAGILNIDVNSVTSQVKDILSGKEAGSLDSEGELKSIKVDLPKMQVKKLKELEIISGEKKYRLDEIASIEYNYASKEILRKQQNRIGKITGKLKKDAVLDKVVKEINEKIATIDLPANYKIKIAGEEEKRKKSFGNLSFALILSIILVYMVMASQFESLVHPFTILLSIPLAIAGSLFAFFILGQTLNIMAYIGIIMLAGIAVNDSIILVDAINRLKKEGEDLMNAIKKAGLQRIRPIIMTSLTTILALLPLCFGFGESASLRSPMAIAVIGGLITSTLLTLVVIPCLYYIIDRIFIKK